MTAPRHDPRVIMGFVDGSAVVLDPSTPVAAAMQTLAWRLRTGRDIAMPTAGAAGSALTAGTFLPTSSA